MQQADSIEIILDKTGKVLWHEPVMIVFKNEAPESAKIEMTLGTGKLASERNIVCHNSFGEHVNIRVYLKDGLLFGDCGACGEQLKLRSSWDTKEQARFADKKDYDILSNAFLVLLSGFFVVSLWLFVAMKRLKKRSHGVR